MSGSGRPSLLMWMEYVTSSPNSKKLGPPGGYSSGMKFARIVTVFGRSGLTNAYRSVLSATGSLEIPGASRCDDMTHLRDEMPTSANQLLPCSSEQATEQFGVLV